MRCAGAQRPRRGSVVADIGARRRDDLCSILNGDGPVLRVPVEQTVQFSPDCVARRPRNGSLDDARRQAEFNERVAIEAHLPVPKPRHRCCERCVRGQLRGEVRDRVSAVGIRVRSASIVRHQALQDGLVLGKTRTVPPASFILNERNRSARRQCARRKRAGNFLFDEYPQQVQPCLTIRRISARVSMAANSSAIRTACKR